jgi:putative two-component system response regulator
LAPAADRPPLADRSGMSDRDPTVLVVDDQEDVRHVLGRLLGHEGYGVALAADGAAALEAVAVDAPDVVLLDVRMPGELDGFDVCRRLRSDPATRLLPVVIITGLHAREDRLHGIEAGADDLLTKPFDRDELLARVRSLIRLKRYTDDFDSAASIVMTLASMIEARDGYSDGHCHRMANYATRVGRALALEEAQVQTLHRGAFLHDIGMLTIPEAVLQKPGSLAPEEWALLKSHTISGERLCGNLRSLQAVRPIVRYHHERLDGSGYPDGLSGDQVPLLAQIVGTVDTYEALTTPRPYQRAIPPDQAFAVLREQVRRGWRRDDLVETFIGVVVRLHSGEAETGGYHLGG